MTWQANWDPRAARVYTHSRDFAAIRMLIDLSAPRVPALRPWRFVDVGANVGLVSVAMAAAGRKRHANRRTKYGHCWAIDDWVSRPNDVPPDVPTPTPQELEDAFYRNVGWRIFREIHPLKGDALEFARRWPIKDWPHGFSVDLVWLNDPDTSYERTKALIQAWQPIINGWGVLCGHDYGVSDGVAAAVDELLPRCSFAGDSVWWQQINACAGAGYGSDGYGAFFGRRKRLPRDAD